MSAGESPLLIGKNQVAFSMNVTNRGGFFSPRNPVQVKALNFNGNGFLQSLVLAGNFQGGGYYRPDSGTESLVAQISGHLIKFTENSVGVWTVTDISIPGDFNSATVNQVWMWQAERWLIVEDGTGNLPIFYDGTSSRRSYGPSVLLATTASNFTPPAIGATVTLALTAPYGGPYNVPVILDGEFYQPVQSANGYKVLLTTVYSTAVGSTIPIGSTVVIQPNTIGVVTSVATGSFTPYPYAAGTWQAFINLSSTTGIGGFGSQIVIDGITWVVFVHSGNFLEIRTLLAFPTSPEINVNDYVNGVNSSPNVIVGNTLTTFVVPAVGASANVQLSNPFNGTPGQLVWINNQQFSIVEVTPPPSGNSLIVINLTDTNTSAVTAPATIMSVPELPAGRQGAYGMGCNCVVLTDGISYIVGDVVGAGSGTPANNYRDSVLKTTQNTFLAGGGSFRLPGTGETATAVIFPPNLDTSLGQGPLQIGTPFSFFTNVVPGTDPATWDTLTFPIQTESLKDNGPLGQNSTISVNSDTFFRSNIGIGSLVLARRAFQGWGNKPISHEVSPLLLSDDLTLLQYSSAMSFSNRFFCTNFPVISPNGIIHRGMVSLNFDLISTLQQTQPPAWEGLQTGLNIFQSITGRVNGSLRAFSFTYNYLTEILELYEFLPDNTTLTADNGVTPIVWAFETAVMFNKDVKSLNELIQLRDGEIYLSDITGPVKVQVFYRPDFYPCWTPWHQFDVCQASDANNSQAGYRMRIGLGQPDSSACEASNNRPLRNGYFFQFRIVITGQCTFKGMRVKAVTVPQPEFAPMICNPTPCQIIDCTPPDNYALYSLQGVPPSVPPPDNTPLPFANGVVALIDFCGNGLPYFFGTLLPTWITVDTVNNQIVGAAGLYRGATQASADAAALAGLTSVAGTLDIQCGFYNVQETVTCGDSTTQTVPAGVYFSTVSQADANNQAIALANAQCANPSCSGTDTGKYKILGYFDGLVAGGGDAAQAGDVVWDGTFQVKDSSCEWIGGAVFASGKILISGQRACARIYFHTSPDEWILEIFGNISGGCNTRWGGPKTKGSSPAGTYTLNEGNDPTPATLTVVPF